MKFIFIAISLSIILSGCSEKHYMTPPIKAGSLNVLFSLPLGADGNQALSVYGDTLYVPESAVGRLTAIDLKSMKVLWRVNLPDHLGICSTTKLRGDVFLLDYHQKRLLWISGDGVFKGTITMPKEVGTLGGSTEFGASDTALLLPGINGSLWRLNPETDLVPDPNDSGNFNACPSPLWVGKTLGSSVPYWEKGFVYWGYGEVLPDGSWSDRKHFLKIEEISGKVIWDIPMNKIAILSRAYKYRGTLLGTGGGIQEISLDGKDIAQLGTHFCSIFGFLLDRDKLFASSINPPGNIFGMNVRSGKILWTQNYPYTAEASPQINNGILYYPLPDGIRVYRESDGEFLGVDSNVHGALVEDGPTIRYKDLLIVRSELKLWIIRMDYNLSWFGNLVQKHRR
jgi:outer membrane protein assembly factor BamB